MGGASLHPVVVFYNLSFLGVGSEDFSGTYTCSAQTIKFQYTRAWELRAGVVHWSARVRFLSSFWDAGGTLLEDRRSEMADAVRHWRESLTLVMLPRRGTRPQVLHLCSDGALEPNRKSKRPIVAPIKLVPPAH